MVRFPPASSLTCPTTPGSIDEPSIMWMRRNSGCASMAARLCARMSTSTPTTKRSPPGSSSREAARTEVAGIRQILAAFEEIGERPIVIRGVTLVGPQRGGDEPRLPRRAGQERVAPQRAAGAPAVAEVERERRQQLLIALRVGDAPLPVRGKRPQ